MPVSSFSTSVAIAPPTVVQRLGSTPTVSQVSSVAAPGRTGKRSRQRGPPAAATPTCPVNPIAEPQTSGMPAAAVASSSA